nr:MAG TPA: hypothetical protein [Caudoviricetes sp.]
MTALTTLYKWFSDLKKPNGAQFKALIDSFWHKSEKIPMDIIDGLDRIVEGTASAQQLQNHLNDTHAHKKVLDKKVDKQDGKDLSTNDFTNDYKQKLENLQIVDISGKVDKEVGKGLSTNDFTNEDKEGIEDAKNRSIKRFVASLSETGLVFEIELNNNQIFSHNIELEAAIGLHYDNKRLSFNWQGKSKGDYDLSNDFADINHNHDTVYAPINHHHNWQEIEGKPLINKEYGMIGVTDLKTIKHSIEELGEIVVPDPESLYDWIITLIGTRLKLVEEMRLIIGGRIIYDSAFDISSSQRSSSGMPSILKFENDFVMANVPFRTSEPYPRFDDEFVSKRYVDEQIQQLEQRLKP